MEEQEQSKESRLRGRSSADCLVTFKKEDGTEHEGTAYNLSPGGCAIDSQATVLDGSYLTLRIMLPGEESAFVVETARVRWSTREEFGVEFLMIQSPKEQLQRFLAKQSAT
ncbi:MAG: PilZ domain-containing protein [Nitrospiraceae bacterium]